MPTKPRLYGLTDETQRLPRRARHRAGILLAALLMFAASPFAAHAQVQFASKQGAFTQGYAAFKGGRYDIAVPALKFAAERDVMRAKFYLAKIHSDNSGGFTDHARAYVMLREIVREYANVDPKDFRVAPYVAKALTSIARYERDGIPALGLRPNTSRALQFFDHAASHFNDRDAQFELAKHYLEGDGVEARVPYALNWLARLSKRGHAGAQAFLANLYWNGRYTVRDRVRALALITVAVENVPEEDRFWIEDLHQNIFCEASRDIRLKVRDVVGGWRQRFGRTRDVNATDNELSELSRETRRMCANGDIVGELGAVPADRTNAAGFNAASATGVDVRPATKGGPVTATGEAVMMSRGKRRPVDHSALNGFPAANGEPGVANGVAGSISSIRSGEDNSKADLNGFTLRGSSSFGFSRTPRQ